MNKSQRVLLVAAESLAEGYAPHTRMNANVAILHHLGHTTTVIGRDDGPYFKASLWQRIKRYWNVNRRAIASINDHDVMLVRGHFAHLPWEFIAWWRGKPIIYEMNGFVFDATTTYGGLRLFQPLIKRIYMLQFRMATTIICVSEEISAHISKLGAYPSVRTVSNGVDGSLFHPAEDGHVESYAIFASSLAPWHGVRVLLDAVESPDWPQDLTLLIAGDGVDADAVRDRAQRTPLINYVGLLERTQLAGMMRRASIGLCLVQPVSHRQVQEVYPLKLFEMMASGLPIIATDLPGQADIVRDAGAGIIVPVDDSKALARAIRALHENPSKRLLGKAAAAAVQERYEWRDGAKLIQRIIEEAIELNRLAQKAP